jgi:hypothetical protein
VILTFTDEELTGDPRPSPKGTVRAEVINAGWMLEPAGAKRTKATLMIESDLKGIPQWALKQAYKEQGYQIMALRETVAKYLEDHPEHK